MEKNLTTTRDLKLFVLILISLNSLKHEHLNTLSNFTPNKSYAYFLNVDPSNLVFLKTYSIEFYNMKLS